MEASKMSFGKALDKLRSGSCEAITRDDWYPSHADPVVKLQVPDEYSKMTEPYLYMVKKNFNNEMMTFPLDLSCESILSDNWILIH